MLKVLILSYECWRDDTNGGNVLSNLFSGQPFEFAQVYCKPGEPQNRLCRRYYHMTDRMMLQNVLHGTPVGNTLLYDTPPAGNGTQTAFENGRKGFYDFFRSHNLASFYAARELLWACADWKNDSLAQFVRSFDPDVIFAPYYASHLMLALDRYVIGLLQKPAVSYVSDDNYSLRQLRFSPVYWMDRLLLRRHVRKTVPYFQWLYTMTEEQAAQLSGTLGCEMRILRKSGSFPPVFQPRAPHRPLRLLYAGGIYLGREKTLAAVASAVRAVNRDGMRMRLDLYTTNALTRRQRRLLDDGQCCAVHPAVDADTLRELYAQSDIALHVESFSLRERLAVRLSFSTKIVDCLASGCAVLAVCEEKQAGFAYLQREDAALCVSDLRRLPMLLERIAQTPSLVTQYAERAWRCGRRNHEEGEQRAALAKAMEEAAGRQL